MLSAIGGTSASYVRSDMSGDSSVKHKGGIKNNYGETASGSNGVSVPVRTSPNANISLWGRRQGRPAGSGVQGWNDGRNRRRSCQFYNVTQAGGWRELRKANVVGRSGWWREQRWTHQFWCLVFWVWVSCWLQLCFSGVIKSSWSLFLMVWAEIPDPSGGGSGGFPVFLLVHRGDSRPAPGSRTLLWPRLLVGWPVSWCLFHSVDSVGTQIKPSWRTYMSEITSWRYASTLAWWGPWTWAKNQHHEKSLWSLFIINSIQCCMMLIHQHT